MKSRTAAQLILWILTASFGLILMLLPLHAFISTWGGTEIGPLQVWKAWKEILLFLLVPLVVGYCVLRPEIARRIWALWVNKLIALYVVLHLFFAVISPATSTAVVAGLFMNLRFLAMFVLAQIIVASNPNFLQKIQKWLLPAAIILVSALSFMAIVQVVLLPKDFLVPFGYDHASTIAPYILVDQNPSAVRAFATLRGPNELGAYLILPLLAVLGAMLLARRVKIMVGLLALGSLALGLTGSRSAWLGAILSFAVFGALWFPRRRLIGWLKNAALPLLAVIALGFWAAITVPQVRLVIFHSSPSDSNLFEGSTDMHWQAVADGVQQVAANPLGQGVGVAGPASFYNTQSGISENYYVQLAQEVGVFGLALFIAINTFVVRRLWLNRAELWPKLLLASFAGLSLINMFLHGWADDPTSMTWWGIAGLFLTAAAPKKGSV